MRTKNILFISTIVWTLLVLINSCSKDDQQIEYGSVTDIDGNIYKTVEIGNQCWMAENLRVIRFRNGNSILNITDSIQWKNITTGAYCDYANDPANGIIYGHLYNWYVANDSLNLLAPEGWHVSTHSDWVKLELYIEDTKNAGWELKEKGFTHWNTCNKSSTDKYGFTAIPGGYRSNHTMSGATGMFFNITFHAGWWTSEESMGGGYGASMTCSGGGMYSFVESKNYGFSIRCVKD